jgi:hypothetical protein
MSEPDKLLVFGIVIMLLALLALLFPVRPHDADPQ